MEINMAELVSVGYGLIQNLKERGIKYIFGVPDGHSMELYDALLRTEGIDHVLVNDERTAGFAADAYARVTGSLGVCDAGAAGSMNLPVAAVEAMGSESPVLCLIGAVRTYYEQHNVAHDINLIDTFKPITKWAKKVINPENSPVFINSAINQAMNGKTGPVALIIPQDVLAESEVPLKEFLPSQPTTELMEACPAIPCSDDVQRAINMIKNAKQPAIFTGESAVNSGAFEEVAQLSTLLQAPVFSTIAGKGIMQSRPYADKLYFGIVGLFGLRPNHQFIRKRTDLVLFVGNRLTEDDTAYFKYPQKSKTTIHIDASYSNIGLNYNSLGLVGDLKTILSRILSQLQLEPPSKDILELRGTNIEWLKRNHISYRKMDDEPWMNAEPIRPERVVKAISDAMDKGDYLVTDASASARWIGPYFPVKSIGRKIITPRGVGPTGFGVGALIGTAFGLKTLYKKDIPKLVLLTGDGGLMNGGLAELETLQKYQIDCTIVVLNNSSLGYVKLGQALIYNWRLYETDRPNTNFAQIAEVFGGKGKVVEKLNDLDLTMQDMINKKGLKLIDVRTDKKALLPRNYY